LSVAPYSVLFPICSYLVSHNLASVLEELVLTTGLYVSQQLHPNTSLASLALKWTGLDFRALIQVTRPCQ
jgi:hypothetical protein